MAWSTTLLADLFKAANENTGNEPSVSCFHRAFTELSSYVVRIESKLAEIEAQEPVRWSWKLTNGYLVNMYESKEDAISDMTGFGEGEPVGLYAQPVQPSPAVAVPDDWREAIEYVSDLLKDVPDVLSAIPTPKETCLLMNVKKIVNKMLSTPTPPSAEQWSHLCNKCGWKGWQQEHEGCGYLAIDLTAKQPDSSPSAEQPKKRKWNMEEIKKYNLEFGRLMSEKYPEWLDDDNEESEEKWSNMWLGYCLDKSKPEQPNSAAVEPDEVLNFHNWYNKQFFSLDSTLKDLQIWIAAKAEAQSTNPQRITEQDAREIALSALRYWTQISNGTVEGWFDWCGNKLLSKLNEHREPDYKAQFDDLQNTIECKDIEIDVLAAQRDEFLVLLTKYRRAVDQMDNAIQDGMNVQGAVSDLLGITDMVDAAIAKASASTDSGVE